METDSISMVASLLDPALKARGFSRRGWNWYRDESESVLVVSLQPSSSWPFPFVNFGVHFKKYGANAQPSIRQCEIWTRLETLVPEPLRVDALVDASTPIAMDDRRTELQGLVVEYGLTWLEGLTTLAEAPTFLARQKQRPVFIAPGVRSELEPRR